ncbi:MAG: dihydrodipicolinate synthase family protein [Porphyromonas sp.]|nr:dihydrodipicolinate synthase family protein [Porphyromonas sp.]
MSKYRKINGLIAAPFTPFSPDGKEVNYEAIPQYAELLHQNGIVGVFINGSSGEGYMLTDEERMKLAQAWKSAIIWDDFDLIVHVGSTCVKSSQKLAAHAQELGAMGTGAMAPPFPKVGRVEELVAYCREIAEGAPDLPFYFYHIPVFNGAYLSMLDFLKLAEQEIPNLAGIKYTYESLYEYNQCMLYKGGKYDMLHGQDETILSALVMGGAKGGISGTASYIGNVLVGILDEWKAGNIEAAVRYQNYAQEVINVIAKYRGNIVAGKRIMKLLGLDLGPNRIPFRNIEPTEEAEIKRQLEAINFFDHCNKH